MSAIASGDGLWPVKRVAEFLGFTAVWFYRNRKDLEATKHFPEPLVGHRYDPLAIKAWRLAQLSPRLRAVLEQAPGGGRIGDFLPGVALSGEGRLAVEKDWAGELDGRAAAMGD